jgi:hypothetical protein
MNASCGKWYLLPCSICSSFVDKNERERERERERE